MSKKKKTPRKKFELTWAFEPFEEFDSFFTKRMFGGMAAYVHDKMVMLLSEKPGDREYRGKEYPFDIWNGILLPTYYEYHEDILKDYPDLIQHPVLKKWLFIQKDLNNFDELTLECGTAIAEEDKRFGIYPKTD